MKRKNDFKLTKIILFLLIFITSITGCQNSPQPKLELKQDSLTVEYGEDVDSLLKSCIDTSIYDNKDIIDEIEYSSNQIKDFNHVAVGKYQIDYKYQDLKKTLTLIVEDTTAPQINSTNEIAIFENDPISYDNYVNVSDLSEFETTIDDSAVKYNTPGTYTTKFSAQDIYGNISSIDIPVTIKELLLQSSSPANITLNPAGSSKFEISTNCSHPITYSSSNTSVAVVDNSGNITAKSAGKTTISAQVNGKQISTTVVVSNPKPVKNTQSSNYSNTQSNDDISYTVYKTKTGDCYHRSGCRYLSRSCIPVSKSNAISQGLRACSICNP